MKKLIILLTLACSVHAGTNKFFDALGKVESSNNPRAVGDKGKSIGIYQIQLNCWKDAIQYDKTLGGTYQDCYKPAYARKVAIAYFRRYEPKSLAAGDYEALARVWNGGPKWRSKKSKTDKYWNKIKKIIDLP